MRRIEEIKFIMCGYVAYYESCRKGDSPFEEGEKIAKKYWHNFNLSKEEIYEFFKKKDYAKEGKKVIFTGETPEWVKNELASKFWEALEYFNLI